MTNKEQEAKISSEYRQEKKNSYDFEIKSCLNFKLGRKKEIDDNDDDEEYLRFFFHTSLSLSTINIRDGDNNIMLMTKQLII